MDKVVHFEMPVDDMARAKQFYGSVFGWELKDWPMEDGSTYVGARTSPVDEKTQMPMEPGSINGGLTRRSKETPSPIITLGVESIDDTMKQVEKGGGKVFTSKTAIPNMGFYAYVKDSEGNIVGLWESLKK